MNNTQIITSFKKEIWEFKKTLFWVPLIIAICTLAAPLLSLMLLEDGQASRVFDAIANVESMENIEGVSQLFFTSIMGLFVPFMMVSLIIQLYYFTACLFDERRDLSVYFWRSMPVSDVLSVGVKLFTGALVVPAIFMLAASIVVLVFLLLALVLCTVLALGYDVSLWELWGQAEIISSLIAAWLSLLPFALWLFPLFAWLMLASMFANKAPFLWAILPIAGLLLIESFVVEYWQLNGRFFLDSLGDYFGFTHDLLPHNMSQNESSQFILFSVFSAKISIVATLLGMGFIYLTYWLRVNRSEI